MTAELLGGVSWWQLGRGGGGEEPRRQTQEVIRLDIHSPAAREAIYCKYYEWSWLGWEAPPFL